MKQEKTNRSLFAQRLRGLISERKLTQQQVADATNVSRISVVKWLKTSIPGSVELFKLAAFLEVSPESLLWGQNTSLTEAETFESVSGVKRTWENLLAELRRATAPSGKVSDLAKFLSDKTGRKVPLASVSRWLADTREPGARITMLMLQWVERERVK